MVPAVEVQPTRTERLIVQSRTIIDQFLGRKAVHCRDSRPMTARAHLTLVELAKNSPLPPRQLGQAE